MSPQHPEDTMSDDAGPRGANANRGSSFSIVRVLAMVVVVAVVGGAAFAVVSILNAPPTRLVPVRGQVVWNGAPVTVGAVMTTNDKDPLSGAVGAFDEEGRFELLTNGQPGALIGTHKVRVASFAPGVAPPPLVPEKYAFFESSPLTMVVSTDESKNVFVFELEGTAPVRPEAESVSTGDDATGSDDNSVTEPSVEGNGDSPQ